MQRRMSVQYGNSVVLQRIVCGLIERFRSGRTSIKHEEAAGRPSTSITDTKTEGVREMFLQNRRVATDTVAHQMQISHGSAF
jgi:hypothetical protein